MAVGLPEARATGRKARVSLKDEARAKVKHKAKVEDAEALRKKNQDKKKDKNQERSGGNPYLTLGGPVPSGGQQNTGPTTRS